MKKIIAICLCIMFTILGCGKANQVHERFTEDLFCEYFKNATYFEELHVLVCEYMNCIDLAYENSDKESLDSFIYDADRLEELLEKIQEYSDSATKSGSNLDENLANLGMAYYCTKIQLDIAEKDLLETVGSLSSSKEMEILNNIKAHLDEAYETFSQYEVNK